MTLDGRLSYKHQLMRLLWNLIWSLFVHPIPMSYGQGWKHFLLNLFGAKISKTAIVYSTAKIYYPSHLIMEEGSCLASDDCYNVDYIHLKKGAVVSQKTYLCTASHDITDKKNHLITAPIVLEEQSWVAADAFVGMGVTIGKGAVVGAKACVFKDVEPWTVVGGNPARFLKKRVFQN